MNRKLTPYEKRMRMKPWQRKMSGVWTDVLAPGLALFGIGAAGCAGCLTLIFIGIFFNLAIAYGVYWVCLNWFGMPYPWPQVLGVATFIGMLMKSSVTVNNKEK